MDLYYRHRFIASFFMIRFLNKGLDYRREFLMKSNNKKADIKIYDFHIKEMFSEKMEIEYQRFKIGQVRRDKIDNFLV